MNISLILIIVLAIFGGIVGIIFTARQKRMKESWKGKIEDKKIIQETQRRDEYNTKVDVFYLYIKLSDGSSKKISVGKKLYDSISIGDNIEKKPGMYDPVKI